MCIGVIVSFFTSIALHDFDFLLYFCQATPASCLVLTACANAAAACSFGSAVPQAGLAETATHGKRPTASSFALAPLLVVVQIVVNRRTASKRATTRRRWRHPVCPSRRRPSTSSPCTTAAAWAGPSRSRRLFALTTRSAAVAEALPVGLPCPWP